MKKKGMFTMRIINEEVNRIIPQNGYVFMGETLLLEGSTFILFLFGHIYIHFMRHIEVIRCMKLLYNNQINNNLVSLFIEQ